MSTVPSTTFVRSLDAHWNSIAGSAEARRWWQTVAVDHPELAGDSFLEVVESAVKANLERTTQVVAALARVHHSGADQSGYAVLAAIRIAIGLIGARARASIGSANTTADDIEELFAIALSQFIEEFTSKSPDDGSRDYLLRLRANMRDRVKCRPVRPRQEVTGSGNPGDKRLEPTVEDRAVVEMADLIASNLDVPYSQAALYCQLWAGDLSIDDLAHRLERTPKAIANRSLVLRRRLETRMPRSDFAGSFLGVSTPA